MSVYYLNYSIYFLYLYINRAEFPVMIDDDDQDDDDNDNSLMAKENPLLL